MKYNVLDVNVSLFRDIYSNTPMGEISLYDFLRGENYREKWQPYVEKYRIGGNKWVKKFIPAVTVSGTFELRHKSRLKEHNGLICIDIDAEGNELLWDTDLRKFLSSIPYIAYCGQSISGKGYFAIIPISNPERHREHFEALRQEFSRVGINIDLKCKDVNRLRVYTYDPDAHINTEAVTYTKVAKISPPTKTRRKKVKMNLTTFRKVLMVISKIVKTQTDITDDYGHWLALASAFYNEFGEAGRELFHIISQINTEKYNEDRTNKQFDDVIGKPYPYTIGTFFKYAKDAGISVK